MIAARDGGARIIAVASGSDGPDDLAEAAADIVVDDLTGTSELLSAIYSDQSQK